MSYAQGTVFWVGGVLPKLRSLDDIDCDAYNAHAINAAADSIKRDAPMTLLGGVGRGKTTILAAIYEELRLQPTAMAPKWGYAPRWSIWTSANEYLVDVKRGWDYAAQFKSEWTDRFSADGIASKIPRLFLDDVGAERDTDFGAATIAELLTERYTRHLPTWIATNLTVDELRARYGDRVVSRIAGSSVVIALGGPDRRLGGAA